MKICVVGIGEIGYANGLYLVDREIDVLGYDINSKVIEKAVAAGIDARRSVPKADIYLVSLPSHYNTIHKVVSKVMSHSPHLISIESTVSPGTCRRLYEFLDIDTHLIHVPHRYWNQDPVNYGVSQLRVIGGINQDSVEAGMLLYNELGIPLTPVSSIEMAEVSKIVENSHRYLQIAYAEELKMACLDMGLDFSELRQSCNTKWNVDIMEARDGIEGCLALAADIYTNTFIGDLITTAIRVDNEYRRYLE